MKRLLVVSLLVCFIISISCVCIFSQEDKETKIKLFLEQVSKRIERLKGTSSSKVSTQAGLRGTKKDTGMKMYWKEKSTKKPTEKELLAFKKGIDLAQNGKKEEAISVLESFVKKYPKSQLVADAKKAIELLKEE